jgi:hypothetical protein
MFFMVPYTAVVVLHRQVWIPATVLIHDINGECKEEKMERGRASGEEIFTLRILRSITAGSSQIDSAKGKVNEKEKAMKPNAVVTT